MFRLFTLQTLKRLALPAGGVLVVALVAIQLVPFGHVTPNPPVRVEPRWNSPQTRELAARACFDCHSNETSWPWYSNVAPFSWVLQRHVDEGREKLNFSMWGRQVNETDEIVEQVREGEMPPWDYGLLHPDARLSGAERDAFLAGLAATFGGDGGDGGSNGRGDRGSRGDDDGGSDGDGDGGDGDGGGRGN